MAGLLVTRIVTGHALVVALTPLLDDVTVTLVSDLRGRGFDVLVVECDPEPHLPAAREPIGASGAAHLVDGARRSAAAAGGARCGRDSLAGRRLARRGGRRGQWQTPIEETGMSGDRHRRSSRGLAAMALAAVLALPVVAEEPPAASLLAWSGVVCIVVGLAAAFAVQSMPGSSYCWSAMPRCSPSPRRLIHWCGPRRGDGGADRLGPWLVRGGATWRSGEVALGANLRDRRSSPPPPLGWWSWAPRAAPGGLVVRIVAFGALVASLALLVVLLRRGAEPPVPSDR